MAGPAEAAGHYWGPIDAMHQFCEAKYTTSPYVAEFWNTFSNIPAFIVPGIYALWRGWGAWDWRLAFLWMNMIMVGVGSFLFHATMRFECEMLDEIPMLMLVFAGLLTKDDTHWMSSGRWKIGRHALCIIGSVVGMYFYLTRGDYGVFLYTFTSVILLDLSISVSVTCQADDNGSWAARGCMIVYALTLGTGRLLWEVERSFCLPGAGGALSWMHVVWHFFAGLACYFGILGDVHIRWSKLGIGMAVDEPGRTWPLVGLMPQSWRRQGGGGGRKKVA